MALDYILRFDARQDEGLLEVLLGDGEVLCDFRNNFQPEFLIWSVGS